MQALQGKTVLLTGASGGIGLPLARELAREGCHLALAGFRNPEPLRSLICDLEKEGVKAACFFYDLASQSGRMGLVEAVCAQFGLPDILINNAGISRFGSIAGMNEAVVNRILETNLAGPMLLTHLLLPEMIQRKSGHILNVSSMAGKAGVGYLAAYSASKAGLISWTYALHQELRGTGVQASVVSPIFVSDAGLHAKLGVRAPLITREVSPERVTRAVLRALKTGKMDINVTTFPMRWMLSIREMIPYAEEWFFNLTGLLRWTRMMGEAADRRRNRS
jgi:short-subunit dehydrogenase